jgi:hypothetical protein
MNETKNYVVNVAINSVLLYLIGRKVRGHGAGVKLGLLGGVLAFLSVRYTNED